METVANNKLIAEFLGMETMTRTQNGWEVAKFNFHNSWDSLMPVINEITTSVYFENYDFVSEFCFHNKNWFYCYSYANIHNIY